MTGQPGSSQPGSSQPSTCPSCGATVRADVPWCTQCYSPLRPERAAAPAGVAEVEESGRTVDVGDPDSAGVSDATRLRADATRLPADAADPKGVERLADQMLAELAAQRDDLHGLNARLPSSRGARAALVALVVLVGTALMVLVMFVLGSLG